MAYSDFFDAISRSLYYATSSVIGTGERVNVERILRRFQSCIYTDVIHFNPDNYSDPRSLLIYFMQEAHKLVPSETWGSMYDTFAQYLNLIGIKDVVVSGSRSEGFDFETSDYDTMFVIDKICGKEIAFHVEDDPEYPGFVKLKIAPEMCNSFITKLFLSQVSVYHEDMHYLTGDRIKARLQNALHNAGVNSRIHGPCLSIEMDGFGENDFAFVLKQDTWPNIAKGCIRRLEKKGWPSEEVVKEIRKYGCLFVPISFPPACAPPEHAEQIKMQWRMSFSVAENQLVHSMNHTQFLTYGLLKMTLKEIIDATMPEVEGLLCSYFLKTAVFWEIVDSNNTWDPSNLVHCYWRCFRRILRWVDAGYCPNFFVPENNMFRAKIHGHNRRILLKALGVLYGDGYSIFQKIPEVSERLNLSGKDPKMSEIPHWYVPEWYDKSKNLIHLVQLLKFNELIKMGSKVSSEKRKLATKEHCEYSTAMYTLFQLTDLNEACRESLASTLEYGNRRYYKEKKMMRLLTLSSPYCVRGYIYLACHFFMRRRYEDSIRLLRKVLSKLRDPNTLYRWEFFDGRSNKTSFRKYRDIDGNLKPITFMMSRHVAAEICMNFNDHKKVISPVLFSNFLMFLCHLRIGCKSDAEMSIRDIEKSLPVNDVTKESLSENTWKLSNEMLAIAKRMYMT